MTKLGSQTLHERAEKKREVQRQRAARVQAAGRDFGAVKPIADIERRESCRFNFRKFCETYNEKAFYLGWADYHLEAIARIEEVVLHGAMYAYAVPRGGGKTTLARMAGLWATSYAHKRYAFLIGSTGPKAEKLLASIKMWVRYLPKYIEDFPEISQSAIELGGRGNAAGGQLCQGESTLITWSKDEYVLPTVPPPPNLDLTSYPDYVDRNGVLIPEKALWAPTSGSRFKTSGITGEGIRGAVETTIEGEELRPDLVLPDDPQTDESAGSTKQNQDRYELITGAIKGMKGPDKKLSMMMPCTKIKPGDMVSVVLDRQRNPLFRGSCRAMLEPMPSDLTAWEPYFERYQYCAQLEPPDFTEANEYYIKHRKELDQDAIATWEDRFEPDEVSAVQHAMNLYCFDAKAFFAEYQNDPQDKNSEAIFLTASEIPAKQHPFDRFKVPIEVQKVTAFIDVQQELLFYCIVGWSDQFDGFVLDYGTYPEQNRILFEKHSIPATLTSKHPNLTEDNRIRTALDEFIDILFNIRLERDSDKKVLQLDAIGVDQRYKPTVVKKVVREKKDSRLVPTYGGKFTGSEKPMNHPDNIKKWTTGGRRLGPNWRIGDVSQGVQSMEINPNFWKTFMHEKLATPLGNPGSISLFKQEPFRHQLFANHLTAEYREQNTNEKYGKFDVWKTKPGGGDNDWLDCLTNCCVMASFAGLQVVGLEEEERTSTRRKIDGSKWGKR